MTDNQVNPLFKCIDGLAASNEDVAEAVRESTTELSERIAGLENAVEKLTEAMLLLIHVK